MAKVKVLNPLPGTSGYTTRRRADAFVRRGVAEYTGSGFLRFISEDRQALNAAIRAEVSRWGAEPARDNKAAYQWRGNVPVWRGKPFYGSSEVRS
jgi:hypothetical protein